MDQQNYYSNKCFSYKLYNACYESIYQPSYDAWFTFYEEDEAYENAAGDWDGLTTPGSICRQHSQYLKH